MNITMHKYIAALVLMLQIAACSNTVDPAEQPANEHIIVLIENGATVAADEQAALRTTALQVLQHLTTLGRRHATRDAQIHLLLSATPNRIAWSGTPRQLLDHAESISTLIAFKPRFSDLILAFEQIATTVRLNQPDAVRLYWIGPVIHAGVQDLGDAALEITLPQAVPELALPEFLPLLTHLQIYGVHDDQDAPLQRYLSRLGVFDRVRDGSLDFTQHGTGQAGFANR